VEPWWNHGGTMVEPWWNHGGICAGANKSVNRGRSEGVTVVTAVTAVMMATTRTTIWANSLDYINCET